MKHRTLALAAIAVAAAMLGAATACRTPRAAAPAEGPEAGAHKLGVAAGPFFVYVTGNGPDAAAATLVNPAVAGFDRFDQMTVDCAITTGTSDASVALDVYLQRYVGTVPDSGDVWVDYAHFPQQSVTGSSASITYDIAATYASTAALRVGLGDASTAAPALDASAVAYGPPGSKLRLVFVTGAAVLTPASATCYFYGKNTGR